MENKHNLKNNLQEQSVQYFPLVNYNKIKSLEYAFPKILSYFFSTDLPFVHFCHFPFQRYRKWCKCFPGTALCAGSMQSKQVCLGQIFACAGFSCTDFNKLSKDNDCSQRGLCQVMLAEAPDLCFRVWAAYIALTFPAGLWFPEHLGHKQILKLKSVAEWTRYPAGRRLLFSTGSPAWPQMVKSVEYHPQEPPLPIRVWAETTYKYGTQALKKFPHTSLNFILKCYRCVISPHLCLCSWYNLACNAYLKSMFELALYRLN